MLSKLRGRKGQGMTEYIIIVALIAIAAIGVVSLFGDNIRALNAPRREIGFTASGVRLLPRASR